MNGNDMYTRRARRSRARAIPSESVQTRFRVINGMRSSFVFLPCWYEYKVI